MYCAVYGCKSSPARPADGTSFHSFPKDKQLQKAWIVLCRRQDKINVKNARICSVHFNPEDFKPNINDFLASHGLNIKQRKMLKPGAVPSLFLPTASWTKKNDEKKASSNIARSARLNYRISNGDGIMKMEFIAVDGCPSECDALPLDVEQVKTEPTEIKMEFIAVDGCPTSECDPLALLHR